MRLRTSSLPARSEGADLIGKTYLEVAEEAAARGDRAQAEAFIERAYAVFGLEYQDAHEALDAGSFG